MNIEESNPWQTKSAEIKYSNNWIDLVHNEVITPGGKEGIYGVVHFKNVACAILPIDDHHNTYLVGQFRYPLGIYSWEIPMGGSPLAEEPIDGAKRELLEETGLVANTWQFLGNIHTSNCVTDEVAACYLAKDLIQMKPQPEDTEQLTIKKVPFSEAYNMAIDGRITDALSVICILKVANILNF